MTAASSVVTTPSQIEARSVDRVCAPRRRGFRKYFDESRPVVITGEMDRWEAMRWTHELFRTRYAADRVEIIEWAHQSDAPTRMRPMTVADYFETLSRRDWPDPRRPPYMEAYTLLDRHPELEAELGPLRFFANWFEWMPRRPSRVLYNWKNLLLSPKGAVYNLHFDAMSVHACVLQFSGRKRCVLYPYDAAEALYWGKVDPDAPDLVRFPRFADAPNRHEVILSPGDILFVPAMWWHQVTTLDDSVSVVVHGLNHWNVVDFAASRGVHAADIALRRVQKWVVARNFARFRGSKRR
jgi:hypothetical protein